ncbi:MAG: GNAT family N-acetyltransferase [Actinomycetota bacterium]|nr:GNAT family N-acetyltransferase [Actinomycetota bacterium]
MASIPELPDTLTDGVVSLRLYAERDIPEILIAYQDDPQLPDRLGQLRPPSGAELGGESERAAAERTAGQRVSLTILEPGSDTCVGRLLIDEFDWDNDRARMQVWIAPAVRRRGLASAAMGLASRWLFHHSRLERLEVFADPGNQPALSAAAAAGFSREGVLRAYEGGRRGRHDMVSFSLLRGDIG